MKTFCLPVCHKALRYRRGRIILTDVHICAKLDSFVFETGKIIFDRPVGGRTTNDIYPGAPSIESISRATEAGAEGLAWPGES